jgi:5-methylcytosine-specific restriction enzyme A
MCLARGLVVPATIADHIDPHKGDWNAFLSSPLQSLCFDCHNSRKKADENRGYSRELGTDGWPVDPKHPANRPREANGGFRIGGVGHPSGQLP